MESLAIFVKDDVFIELYIAVVVNKVVGNSIMMSAFLSV